MILVAILKQEGEPRFTIGQRVRISVVNCDLSLRFGSLLIQPRIGRLRYDASNATGSIAATEQQDSWLIACSSNRYNGTLIKLSLVYIGLLVINLILNFCLCLFVYLVCTFYFQNLFVFFFLHFAKYYIQLTRLLAHIFIIRLRKLRCERHQSSPIGWVHFVGAGSWFAEGSHIFFKCGKAEEQTRAGRAGGPGPCVPPPRRYGTAPIVSSVLFVYHPLYC